MGLGEVLLAQGVVSLCLFDHIFIPERHVAGVVSHLLGLFTFKTGYPVPVVTFY